MRTRDVLATFNRGLVSRLALARTDVSRVALSASEMTNWLPRRLGPMSLRPGFKYVGEATGDGVLVPFFNRIDDQAIIEFTADSIRVWNDGDTLLERGAVSSTVTNGFFVSDLSGWTDADETGTQSDWLDGQMRLQGSGALSAKRQQQVTVSVADRGQQHALRINVSRGSAVLRVGTTAGADDVLPQVVLRTGVHSLSFTPDSDFWIELSTPLTYPVLVEAIQIESAGTVLLPTPWTTDAEAKVIRWAQSGDVIYLAFGEAYIPRRLERRVNDSWSIVEYETTDGPFGFVNTESTTLTPSGISGEITVTASKPTFVEGQVGSLINLSSIGQRVESNLAAELTFTDTIRVTGVGTSRLFNVILAGTFSGTVTLQQSIGAEGSWSEVETYTTAGTRTYNDGLDNSIVFYRIGFEAGDYTSGTAEATLQYSAGSITGTVRVTEYTSETEVGAVVVRPLGGTDATDSWAEGAWSSEKGWPESVALWQGRLWWQIAGQNYGSESDAFTSFDEDIEGDSAPINRRIGEGKSDKTNWAMPLQRLIIGTDAEENAVRSNSFDEPVTPTNYNSSAPSTNGSAPAVPAMVDARGYFIDRTARAVFEMQYAAEKYDYNARDLTLLIPEIGDPGFIKLVVQQRPDMRIHAIRSDGTVAICVRDAAEDILCWSDLETNGFVEDAVVLHGDEEDRVFYRIKRTVNGSDVRYLEEMAKWSECEGGSVSMLADSSVAGTGAITGLDHLEGEEVVIWADGADQGTATVSGGAVSGTYTNWCAGLPYTARYKSAKLAGETSLGLSLLQKTRINSIGLVLDKTHYQGLRYGPSFDYMDSLPLRTQGKVTDADTIWDQYDESMFTFPGNYDTDARICLEAAAPRPATVLALVMNVERHDAL